jgi:hypothetical protein
VHSALGRPADDSRPPRDVGEAGEAGETGGEISCSSMDPGECSSRVGQTEIEPSAWPVAYSPPFGATSKEVIARGCKESTIQ